MKTFLAAAILTLAPVAALAQGAATPPPTPQQGQGGPGWKMDPKQRAEQMQKRGRLALTLGLAEALDLDAAQALKVRDAIAQLEPRRTAARKQLHDAGDVLRRAAKGEKVSAAEVDQAISKAFEARQQMEAVNKDTVAAVTKDLSPEKRARAVLFLARFEHRMHGRMGGMRGMGPGGMHGPGGPGMGPGMHGMHGGMGRGMGPGMGMGPGQMGPDAMAAGPCMNGDCPMMDDFGGDEDDGD